MNPSTIARTLPTTTQVFHGARSPCPTKRKAWLHQLLGQLPPIDRAVMFLHLAEQSQRQIASHLSMSQPGVCYRLRAAKRRLLLLSKFPSPPVTLDEARAAGLTDRDAEILTRLQSARAVRVEREMGLRRHGMALLRMRAQVPPANSRVKELLDLVCAKGANPFYQADRRTVYRAPGSDGQSGNDPPPRR